ncbi:hypothetical protein B0H21DRAFT_180561 [Amylocystis lapponica]|nr:hypothetical protein B0H21DRAFT_180561 [Amylocystis lapponica]
MAPAEFRPLLDAVIASVEPDNVEDSLEKLRFFFPDTLVLAALDLIDHDNVIKYTTPWGRSQYEVLGTTANYSVFLALGTPSHSLSYCTCPAFAYSVLLSESHLMCKHVLATLLAQRLSRCVERPMTQDELAAFVLRQYN